MISANYKIRIFALVIGLFLLGGNIFSQEQAQSYSTLAQSHMKAGRYGEAIALWNKYVTFKPRDVFGYNQRALCYEKRSQFEYAIVDMKKAIKLAREKGDKKEIDAVWADFSRMRETFDKILEKKIEGHKREIAIDPEDPFNYLEIGKSYANMEKFPKAEDWYDQYLARDPNASPDEILRYTNVLSMNKHYGKAEGKLKEYTEKYPKDHRLWNKLGYISNWLSKYKQAEEAFLKALSFKPYFKLAEEGLDVARREGYIINYVDTDTRKQKQKEYPVDKYYRLVKQNPRDYESRFNLVDELVKVDRLEEAYQQLLILQKTHSDDNRFIKKWDYVTGIRNKKYETRVANAQKILEKDPYNENATLILAQNYELMEDYESSLGLLDVFFEENPDNRNVPLMYMYARLLGWYKDFEVAIGYMDKVLEARPDNLDYQLYRAQLSVWNTQDFGIARKYLENVYAAKPKNVSVLLTYSSLEMHEANFEEAEKYLQLAKEIAPENQDVIYHESTLEFRKLRYEEERIGRVLEEGRKLAIDEHYDEALPYYEQYLAEAEPNDLITKEYGVINFRAKYYEKALQVYNELLAKQFDPDVAVERGQVYYALDDPENAINDFRRAVYTQPEDINKRIFLADAYTKYEMYSEAEKQLDTLEYNMSPDSTQLEMIKKRRNWIPARGLNAILYKFPSHIRLGPVAAFYTDDLDFQMIKFGSMLEMGVTDFMAVGVSLFRTSLKNSSSTRAFTTFKGNVFFTLTKNISAGAGYGVINSTGIDSQTEIDGFIRLTKDKLYEIRGSYIKSDAGINLYSPSLVNVRRNATIWRADGFYQHKAGIKVSGYFQYITAEYVGAPDETNWGDNEGNQLQLRIGRKFIDYIEAGYEYYFSNFKYDSEYYYSPQGFESHSLWGEAEVDKTVDYEIYVGGKLGYVPASDFLIREAYIRGEYKVLKYLIINGRLGYGSTYRDDSSYNSFSGEISASWMIY